MEVAGSNVARGFHFIFPLSRSLPVGLFNARYSKHRIFSTSAGTVDLALILKTVNL